MSGGVGAAGSAAEARRRAGHTLRVPSSDPDEDDRKLYAAAYPARRSRARVADRLVVASCCRFHARGQLSVAFQSSSGLRRRVQCPHRAAPGQVPGLAGRRCGVSTNMSGRARTTLPAAIATEASKPLAPSSISHLPSHRRTAATGKAAASP